MEKQKEINYIFEPKLLKLKNDLEKILKMDEISKFAKLGIVKHFSEWVITDFLYRMNLKNDADNGKNINEIIEKLNHKKIPKELKIIKEAFPNNSNTIFIDDFIKCWIKIIISNYHHFYKINKNNFLKKSIEKMYILKKNLQNIWWNSKIKIAPPYQSGLMSHINQNNVVCCTSDIAPTNTERDGKIVDETTIKEIWNYIVNDDIPFPLSKKNLCTWCLKRIFGLNASKKDNSIPGFKAVKSYIRKVAKL